jgi:thioredoxin-dependent adenylylsulfate APS reductase
MITRTLTPKRAPTGVPALDAWRDEHLALPPEKLLEQTFHTFGEGAALVTSFQAEGLVLLDMTRRRLPDLPLRVITLDTGRLPQETYDLMERVRGRYGIALEIFSPDPARLEPLIRRGGPNLFYRSPEDREACCHVRKVEPLGRALEGLCAWITGLRRGQSAARAHTETLALEDDAGRLKLSPLAEWSWERVWHYIEDHRVPYHPLYDQGYTSIGCAPCTRPVRPGAGARSGRWWWETEEVPKECGLHRRPLPTVGAEGRP